MIIAFLFLVIAVPVYAQEASVAAEIRAALQEQATTEGLSQGDFDTLVASLTKKSVEAGITPERITESVATPEFESNDGFVESEVPQEQSRGGHSIALGVLVLIVLALGYFIYRKMEQGGALSRQ